MLYGVLKICPTGTGLHDICMEFELVYDYITAEIEEEGGVEMDSSDFGQM